jgi:hypothetical protein
MSVKLADGWEPLGQPHGQRGAGLRLWDGTQWLYEDQGQGGITKPMKVWDGSQWQLACNFVVPQRGIG